MSELVRRTLIIGDLDIVTAAVTLKSGTAYKAGAVLASITASGASDKQRTFTLVDNSKNDGTEKPKCILAGDVDATGGDTPGIAYKTGQFNESMLTFGGNDTVDDHRDALEERGIFLDKPVAV